MKVRIKGVPKKGIYNKMELFVSIFLLQNGIYSLNLESYKYIVTNINTGDVYYFRSVESLISLIETCNINSFIIE